MNQTEVKESTNEGTTPALPVYGAPCPRCANPTLLRTWDPKKGWIEVRREYCSNCGLNLFFGDEA